jgi:hypothetical protein
MRPDPAAGGSYTTFGRIGSMAKYRPLTPLQVTALSLVVEGKLATGTIVHRHGRLYLAFDHAGADYSNQIYSLRKRKLLQWIAERTVGITPEGVVEYEKLVVKV